MTQCLHLKGIYCGKTRDIRKGEEPAALSQKSHENKKGTILVHQQSIRRHCCRMRKTARMNTINQVAGRSLKMTQIIIFGTVFI